MGYPIQLHIHGNVGTINLANAGSTIQTNSYNQSIQILQTHAPELASRLEIGMNYPELAENLRKLTEDLSSLKNATSQEKPSLFKRVSETLGGIKNISDGIEVIGPYVKGLYALAKPFAESCVDGLKLPEWS